MDTFNSQHEQNFNKYCCYINSIKYSTIYFELESEVDVVSNNTFERIEKKYLMTASQKNELLKAISKYIVQDEYGLHTICNIYYDTEDYSLIKTSLEKPVYKEKLRLRSYGIPSLDSKVFLEIKKKYDGVVYKRRIDLTLKEAYDYLGNHIRPSLENRQIFKEIDYFMNFYQPKASMYIAYDRRAYYGVLDPEFRMTIDTNIRSRDYDLRLEKGDQGNPLFMDELYLMEIKVRGALPMWIVKSLSELKIYPTSFSKYGQIFTKEVKKGEIAC